MKLKTVILVAMIGLGALSFMLQTKASEMPERPHLATSGTGSVDATPDIATIAIEVSVSAKEVADAKKQVDARVAQYFDFLRKNGVESKDMNAANLSTQPEYDDQKTSETLPKGYRAVRQVQITVHRVNKINELLDGALKFGLNEIRDIKLSVANPTIYHEQARKKAIENAITQASALAEGFNVKLGPVYSIGYHMGNYQPRLVMYSRTSLASPNDLAKTYEQETIHFDDQVDVVFELQTSGPAELSKK
jgi:uncharacterized protein